jgi:hypothetical protein
VRERSCELRETTTVVSKPVFHSSGGRSPTVAASSDGGSSAAPAPGRVYRPYHWCYRLALPRLTPRLNPTPVLRGSRVGRRGRSCRAALWLSSVLLSRTGLHNLWKSSTSRDSLHHSRVGSFNSSIRLFSTSSRLSCLPRLSS